MNKNTLESILGCKPKDKIIPNKWKISLQLYNTWVDLGSIPMVLCLSAVGCVHARLWDDALWNTSVPISATRGNFLTLYLHGLLFCLSLVLGNCPFGHNLKTNHFFSVKNSIPVLFYFLWQGIFQWYGVVWYCSLTYSGEWIAPTDSTVLFACTICVVLAAI